MSLQEATALEERLGHVIGGLSILTSSAAEPVDRRPVNLCKTRQDLPTSLGRIAPQMVNQRLSGALESSLSLPPLQLRFPPAAFEHRYPCCGRTPLGSYRSACNLVAPSYLLNHCSCRCRSWRNTRHLAIAPRPARSVTSPRVCHARAIRFLNICP